MTQPPENLHKKQKIALEVLKKRRDFVRLTNRKQHWVAKTMVVQKALFPEDHPAPATIRIGYTASRKVGNAVMRNRARRRLRAVTRPLLSEIGEAGHDYVVVARASSITAPFDQLIRDFSWCVARLKTASGQNSGEKGRKK